MFRKADLSLAREGDEKLQARWMRRHEASIAVIGNTELERECLVFRLVAAGFDVRSAPSVATLHRHHTCGNIDLMLLYTDRPEQEIQGQLEIALSLYEHVPVAILTSEVHFRQVALAVERGARGYIATTMPVRLVIAAIRLLLVGGVYLPATRLLSPTVTRTELGHPVWRGKFTKRQSAVMDGIRRGKPNKIIAYELDMCESTVKIHIRNMMRKLEARNRTELAFKANSLIEPPIEQDF